MTNTSLLTLVLAAGQGTRMKSRLPKVLHALAGRSMLGHVMETAKAAGAVKNALVVAPQMDAVRDYALQFDPNTQIFVQDPRLGTAHAVLAARQAIDDFQGHVIVLYGDTPLLTTQTLERMSAALEAGAGVAILGFDADDPSGYGRLLMDGNGELSAIREHRDASPEERKITFCNSGVIGFRSDIMLGLLDRIGNSNAKGEYYLTDAVEIARSDGIKRSTVTCDEQEVLGINTRRQLAAAEALLQSSLRIAVMDGGATLIDPDSVHLSFDTEIGQDVLIEPNVFFGPGVRVEDGVVIHGFCHMENARIGPGAEIGPYARLRPGADLGESVKIGNFVEVKKSVIERGAKVNHLTYIGDARVGSGANVGAGTIICNYDGFHKHQTDIGAGAFIGSNSALIAPINIGDGAYIGSGSVVSKDVPANSLVVTRAPRTEREDWALKFRAHNERIAAKKRNSAK
ncbi:bifunctional protein GlmU [bacterium MnTg02]|nr:bifunctional protein GlmU [bacterium MnTg02]